SYKAPREILCILGVVIYLLMMATGFMGYFLPWGQMSFWGATVITGFFSAFPLVGEWVQQFLLGGFAHDLFKGVEGDRGFGSVMNGECDARQ
ncbi:cytochrome b N-terminal domain-containing protein, partial [Rhizobium ruizarguesonis]